MECKNTTNATLGFERQLLLWMWNYHIAAYNIAAMIFSGLIMFVGVIGNGFVVYAYGMKFKRTTANTYILWLAIFDLACCCLSIPFEIYVIGNPVLFDNDILCRVFRSVSMLTYACEGLMLMCIALDRYQKICSPIPYSNANPKIRVLILITTAIVISWTSACIYGKSTVKNNCIPGLVGSTCAIADDVQFSMFVGLFYGFLLTVFVTSFCIMFFLYLRVFKRIWQWKRSQIQNTNIPRIDSGDSLSSQGTCTRDSLTIYEVRRSSSLFSISRDCDHVMLNEIQWSSHSKLHRKAQLTKTTVILSAVTLSFLFSYLPYLLSQILLKSSVVNIEDLSPTSRAFYEVLVKTYCINNATNPIIYLIYNKQFRLTVKEIFIKP